MVEKVFISPNRVRAYGNIVNMKTGDDFTLVNSELTVTTDTVDGAEMTVFQFEVEGGISIALVSSSSTCNVGDNVLLTATVLEDSAPVEAAEVTFKVGETVLGTDETDANGVATYTYATSSAGSLSFSASYQTSTSNSVSVTVNHSYSLAFSQATYTASGGSATLEMTLLEDNVAKTGASITVTGSDGSVYNGITNTNGIASVTVSDIISETTFTCTYNNVSDTARVYYMAYQPVEYLQSNGSQYINTGYILKANDKVEVSVSMQGSGSYNGVFGARKGSYQYNCFACFGRFGSQNKFIMDRTNNSTSPSYNINANTIYDLVALDNDLKIYQNGTLLQTLTNNGTLDDCVNPCGLFVINTYNGADGFNKDTYGYMKIYSFKITDSNNNVVMDLIPVRSGTTGYMYDKVTGNLMTNYGTFLYGEDI